MEYLIVTATQISIIEELVKFVSDNGVMMVISVVVIYFLIKVLNSMLEQNERTNAQIVPELQKIRESITDVIVKNNEAESRRTISQNRQVSKTREAEKSIMASLQKIETQLTDLEDSMTALTDKIERINIYLELNKDKDDEQ